MDRYLTPGEVATRLRRSTRTVIRRIESGAIAGIREGASWRVSETALAHYIKLTCGSSTGVSEGKVASRGRARRSKVSTLGRSERFERTATVHPPGHVATGAVGAQPGGSPYELKPTVRRGRTRTENVVQTTRQTLSRIMEAGESTGYAGCPAFKVSRTNTAALHKPYRPVPSGGNSLEPVSNPATVGQSSLRGDAPEPFRSRGARLTSLDAQGTPASLNLPVPSPGRFDQRNPGNPRPCNKEVRLLIPSNGSTHSTIPPGRGGAGTTARNDSISVLKLDWPAAGRRVRLRQA